MKVVTLVMKVVTLKDVPNVPMEGAEQIQGYTGPVSRSRQTIIQAEPLRTTTAALSTSAKAPRPDGIPITATKC
jgi:hypothetical protein